MTKPSLFIIGNLSRFYLLSFVVALSMAIVSLAGLFFRFAIYPTEELRQSFLSNDIVNIFIGLPTLLGSLWLARRGKLIGLLLLPGALFYITYNYIAYAVAMPFALLFIPYLLLVVLSLYTIVVLLLSMDSLSIQNLLQGAVYEHLAGGVLIGFGVLFILRGIGQIVGAFTAPVTLNRPGLSVLVADLLTFPPGSLGASCYGGDSHLGISPGQGCSSKPACYLLGYLSFSFFSH